MANLFALSAKIRFKYVSDFKKPQKGGLVSLKGSLMKAVGAKDLLSHLLKGKISFIGTSLLAIQIEGATLAPLHLQMRFDFSRGWELHANSNDALTGIKRKKSNQTELLTAGWISIE